MTPLKKKTKIIPRAADSDTENHTPSKGPVFFMQNNNNSVSLAANIEDSIKKHSHNNSEHELIDRLANETLEESRLEAILSLRNLITACNKKKNSLIKNPKFRKILCIIDCDDDSNNLVKAQFALLLCSIAKGAKDNVDMLNELSVDERLCKLILTSSDDTLIEACLRCLRVLISRHQTGKLWSLYGNQDLGQNNIAHNDIGTTQKIIHYARKSDSFIVQQCIADIFASTCFRSKEQSILFRSDALTCISELIESRSSRVIVSALNWLSSICLKNKTISSEASKITCSSGLPLLSRLIDLMSKDECNELQFLSAKCFSQIYKALKGENLEFNEARIVTHVLPTLVRMVHRDKPSKLRAEAAECIAYLVECDTRLQELASICDHLIESLATMIDPDPKPLHDIKGLCHNSHLYSANNRYSIEVDPTSDPSHGYRRVRLTPHLLAYRNPIQLEEKSEVKSKAPRDIDSSNDHVKEMKRAAFLALAVLASTLEPIRKKIFDTGVVMDQLVKNLVESEPATIKSVLTCLLSLSRSVQQLRTSFSEDSIYTALKSLLNTQTGDTLILVLAILCNISLDFSPGKQHFYDSATINTLCNLTKGTDHSLRLHGMWILMNMVYQLGDRDLKFQILKALGADHVTRILEEENQEDLKLKTLGFLRNLLSQKQHIDAIMADHGDQIIKSLAHILDRQSSTRVKEQTLCVLANIADGSSSKTLIMNNRLLMSYLSSIICDDEAGDLRLAAICCITNLAHKEFEGSNGRLDEMRKFGIEDKLKSMLKNTNDPVLSDRVRTAYTQFLRTIEDKKLNA